MLEDKTNRFLCIGRQQFTQINCMKIFVLIKYRINIFIQDKREMNHSDERNTKFQ